MTYPKHAWSAEAAAVEALAGALHYNTEGCGDEGVSYSAGQCAMREVDIKEADDMLRWLHQDGWNLVWRPGDDAKELGL